MKKSILILLLFNFLIAYNCNNKLFSLSTEGKNSITLQSIISDVSDSCHLNVIIKDNLSKERLKDKIKYIKLKDLTLKEFLDYILSQNGFFYTLKNNSLSISYIKTKNFKIDYINSTISGTTNFSASTTNNENGTNTLNSTFTFDFWKEFSDNINKILTAQTNYYFKNPEISIDSDGIVTLKGTQQQVERIVNTNYYFKNPDPIIDKTSGLVTITGTKSQLDRVQQYIDELNERLHKEVLIDVKIYSVKLTNNNQTGINWSDLSIKFGGENSLSTPLNIKNVVGSGSIFQSGTFNINGLLNFLSSYGQLNSISNPKITTLNNQKAIITVGQTINYSYKTVTTDANGNAIQSDKIDSKFVGILLDITPEISDKGVIMMNINPSVSSLAPTQLNPNLPPDTIEKKLKTIIRVKNGDTIILGGLITDEKTFVNNGVPILKEIPIIKYLFSSKQKISKREELVFVITPHIINLDRKINIKDIGYKLPNLGDL